MLAVVESIGLYSQMLWPTDDGRALGSVLFLLLLFLSFAFLYNDNFGVMSEARCCCVVLFCWCCLEALS